MGEAGGDDDAKGVRSGVDGADTHVLWGCVFDLVNALACIGAAVTSVARMALLSV